MAQTAKKPTATTAEEIVLEGMAHSPAHIAVARRDHAALQSICAELPKFSEPTAVLTEEESLREEGVADAIAEVIDRRDVPGRETPLHVAVRADDVRAVEILMEAGANWSLQNEAGWSALQEAICLRRDEIAVVIMRHYQPMAWAKWCRRLPRLIACLRRMRDFYMEIHFEFQSSVIPFVARIAPSDTYRIWKRDSNLRADTTLAGFDGFRIQRAQQSFLFLGEGLEDGSVPPGSLLVLSHRDKEVMNAFEDAGEKPSSEEVTKEVMAMVHTNVYRPGIDVTQAELVPQLNWRRQERSENVGKWRAKLYDMHHVMLSFKSRRVSDERFHEEQANGLDHVNDEFGELLTEDEKRHMDSVMKSNEVVLEEYAEGIAQEELAANSARRRSFADTKDGDLKDSGGRRSTVGRDLARRIPPRRSSSDSESKELQQGTPPPTPKSRRRSVDSRKWISSKDASRDDSTRRSSSTSSCGNLGENGSGNGCGSGVPPLSPSSGEGVNESVYKKGLRPVLWLSHQFPLQTEELLPLLDILANKVKAVRRLRELLTTKLPSGTFPVKIAIPVVPTIRVVVTFTRFEELGPSEEFSTPPSSPETEKMETQRSSQSWFPSWIRHASSSGSSWTGSNSERFQRESTEDAFAIPRDYSWTTLDAKKKRMNNRNSKSRKGRRNSSVDMTDLPN